jgi:hypothetical protein
MEERAHRKTVIALVVVAALAGVLAIFALWANRQLLNTDNWAKTSSELLENDEIRGQVASFLADELYANVDVKQELQQVLPPQAAGLAAPAAAGLKQLAEKGVNGLLTRPVPQQLWEGANRETHKQVLSLLEGGGAALSSSNGEVVLDLKQLLKQSQSRLGIGGRIADKLPEDAAQIDIMKSEQLGFAQDLVQVLKALAIVLLLLTLGLLALAVWLARGWRREALRACGVALIFAGAAALVLRELGRGEVVDALARTASIEPTVEATWSISTSLLVQAATASIAYGVVILFAAWLGGPTHAAVRARGWLDPVLREPRLAYGSVAALVLLLVAWGPTPATQKPLGVLLLIVLLVGGMRALRHQTAREHPAG